MGVLSIYNVPIMVGKQCCTVNSTVTLQIFLTATICCDVIL